MQLTTTEFVYNRELAISWEPPCSCTKSWWWVSSCGRLLPETHASQPCHEAPSSVLHSNHPAWSPPPPWNNTCENIYCMQNNRCNTSSQFTWKLHHNITTSNTTHTYTCHKSKFNDFQRHLNCIFKDLSMTTMPFLKDSPVQCWSTCRHYFRLQQNAY